MVFQWFFRLSTISNNHAATDCAHVNSFLHTWTESDFLTEIYLVTLLLVLIQIYLCDTKMSEGNKNKPGGNTGPSLAGVAQTCAQTSSDLKGLGAALNELMKTVTSLQESASATHSQAEINLKSIQANAEAIQDIKSTTSFIQERQEDQNRGLNECLTRIESLEKNQSLFRMIDDQDAKRFIEDTTGYPG